MLKGRVIELVELPLEDGLRRPLPMLEKLRGRRLCRAVRYSATRAFLGTLEAVDALTDLAHARGMLVIGVCNPTSLALLKPPGQLGRKGCADIACGEGQPLGIPVSSGGPYFGYMVCQQALVRQMPGRIVGRTVDLDGKPGFTLTLQAREQHIRRSKATSNICTNQGLMVTAATIYLSLLGGQGLQRMARQLSHANTRNAGCTAWLPSMASILCSRFLSTKPYCDWTEPVAPVLDALAANGLLGGYRPGADFPELGQCLLVCATEARSAEDIERYVAQMAKMLADSQAA